MMSQTGDEMVEKLILNFVMLRKKKGECKEGAREVEFFAKRMCEREVEPQLAFRRCDEEQMSPCKDSFRESRSSEEVKSRLFACLPADAQTLTLNLCSQILMQTIHFRAEISCEQTTQCGVQEASITALARSVGATVGSAGRYVGLCNT